MAIVFEFLFSLIFEIIFAWTGEVVLYVATLGRHKPRWDLYTKESPSRFVIFSEIAMWVGFLFWVGVLYWIVK
jgi:hypothetical protein